MKRIAPVVLLLALSGAFAFWWFSPAQVVKRRTHTLLKVLTLEPGSGSSGRQLGVYSLNALLANDVELQSDSIREANGTFERQDLESAFSWLCRQAKQTRFALDHLESITLTSDQADVCGTVTALVELPNDRPADGIYQVNFRWIRQDDSWRLARATWTGP